MRINFLNLLLLISICGIASSLNAPYLVFPLVGLISGWFFPFLEFGKKKQRALPKRSSEESSKMKALEDKALSLLDARYDNAATKHRDWFAALSVRYPHAHPEERARILQLGEAYINLLSQWLRLNKVTASSMDLEIRSLRKRLDVYSDKQWAKNKLQRIHRLEQTRRSAQENHDRLSYEMAEIRLCTDQIVNGSMPGLNLDDVVGNMLLRTEAEEDLERELRALRWGLDKEN